MALPTSIWVKFKDSGALITYQGQTVLVSKVNPLNTAIYLGLVSGDWNNGVALYLIGATFTGTATRNVYSRPITGGVLGSSTNVGTVTHTGWTVTGFTGADISALTTQYRDPFLPKLLRLPVSESYSDAWEIWMTDNSVVSAYSGSSQFVVVIDDIEVFTGTFALDADNVGTTDCPFVDWIGELSECVVKATPESATWTVPSDIDLTKPVIVECWGSGANGGDANADEGANGGGGGAYGSADVATKIAVGDATRYQVAGSNDGNPSYVQGADESFLSWAEGGNGAGGGSSIGVVVAVSFAGGDAATGQPDGSGGYGGGGGASAAPWATGQNGAAENGGTSWLAGLGGGGNGATMELGNQPTAGLSPGGGGGGGYSDGDASTGGSGADGLIKIWYAVVLPETPSASASDSASESAADSETAGLPRMLAPRTVPRKGRIVSGASGLLYS